VILVVYAHPYPRRSRGGAALLAGIAGIPGLEVRSLYDLYPDFDIDAADEQAALRRADLVVWLGPLYWYTTPALMRLWMEKVLVSGFAHSTGGSSLAGKPCLWAVTTGGGEYRVGGPHDHAFEDFAPVVEMTARYCGMRWLEPFVVHDPAAISDEELAARARALRERLLEVAP
jgi:glutathione-regulated potassium-efflux system ancillary protein KefF